jgi:hypothetical protein
MFTPKIYQKHLKDETMHPSAMSAEENADFEFGQQEACQN